MKKFLTVCAAVAMCAALAGSAQADLPWQMIPFTNLVTGAVSYDESGDNVVVEGRAFYQTIRASGVLGTQLVGGDGQGPEVAGNFAMFGVFGYNDTNSVLPWIVSNANTLLAMEIRARDVKLDFNGDGQAEFVENFTLDAKDMLGVDYLKATFADLGGWGYTQIAPGVWLDIAMDPKESQGNAAMSVVIQGMSNAGWNAAFADGFDAMLLPGALGEPISGVTPGSGFRVAAAPPPIPEPALFQMGALMGLSGFGLLKLRKR